MSGFTCGKCFKKFESSKTLISHPCRPRPKPDPCPSCVAKEAELSTLRSELDNCSAIKENIIRMDQEITRLRGMSTYALDAPNFESCKSILCDLLDGVNGAANYDDVKGERETLRAALSSAEKAKAALCRAREAFQYVLKTRGDNTWNHTALCGCDDCKKMQAALSSTAPCQHEEDLFHVRQAVLTEGLARIKAESEAKRLREAVEWAYGRLMTSDENELRRRSGVK